MALYPPTVLCKKLANLHPWLRLAWHGRERLGPDDLNPGDFAIIQLYHQKDAGTPSDPKSYFLHWQELPFGRGLIFNKHGGTRPDWDDLCRWPIYVADLGAFGITKEQVFSGEFLETIKYWLRPARVRLEENARQMGKDLKSKAADMAGEQTDFLWSQANNADADRIVMTREDSLNAMKSYEASHVGTPALEDYYLPEGVK